MTVVFLDIDGVLVTPESCLHRARTGQLADPRAIEALNRLMAETGARLVIISFWRLEYTRTELARQLRDWGVESEILDITPKGESRAGEIQQWLDEYTGSEPIDSFVILDDMKDMGHLAHRLVRTEFEIGLTMDHAAQAVHILFKKIA